MTLKQSQGYQTNNDNVDPKQGNNHSSLKKIFWNGVREKANVKMFFQTRKYDNDLP